MVFVERTATLVHHGVLLPWLGDHHHDRLADGVTGHGEQLKAVVKRGGIRLVGKADWIELLQVIAKHRRTHHAFARLHPVVVAFDGVNFTVVRHIAVRVGQRPLGEGVGRKALVHQTQRRDTTRVGQVRKIGAHLVRQQQTFVDHRAAGHAGHVILFAVLKLERHDVLAGTFANYVQLALQGVLHDHVAAPANEDLLQDRLFFAHIGRHWHVTVHRHIAPAQQDLAFGLDGTLQLLFTSQTRRMFFGQKHHAYAVFARWRQSDTLGGHFFAVQSIRQLQHDARTVTHQLVSAHCAPMVQILENLECIFHDVMGLDTLDMCHKTHPTGIVLLGGRIQTVVLEMLDLGCRCHGRSCKKIRTGYFIALQHRCQTN